MNALPENEARGRSTKGTEWETWKNKQKHHLIYESAKCISKTGEVNQGGTPGEGYQERRLSQINARLTNLPRKKKTTKFSLLQRGWGKHKLAKKD